jgi:transposase-like protein
LGTIALDLPRLRKGSYFPDWLLSPRRRAERALVQVISESYVNGVSTRRVDRLAAAMGIEGISKSQVSEMAKSLDELVDDFRRRPLEQGPYRYIWVDAITQRCREGGRVVNVIAVTATGVNADGRRELLGLDVFTSEDQAAWETFFNALVDRGLSGVELIVSDDHKGLKAALLKVFVGAGWQRCRTHFARNLLAKVPKAAQDFVAALNRSIFAQPNAKEVWEQHRRVVDQLTDRFEDAAQLLEDAAEDILAFSSFPKAHWRQIWSNNPQERLNREIRRRTDVVSIFPNREAILRLVGAVLAEQNDEWCCSRRYMSLESFKSMHKRKTKEVETVKSLAA